MKGENVMPKVAEALGVMIGEPFAVENSQDDTVEWYKVTMDGMQHFSSSIYGFCEFRGVKGDWCHSEYILEPLLIGKQVWIRRKVEQGELF